MGCYLSYGEKPAFIVATYLENINIESVNCDKE